ncbi:unnamed protein product [Brassicogethes aeneus]|uniref:C2H2-type domain-containing protein n=1 Tax=Brassicogethes aeneus TaxID=1431903 RepID=A0A9P0AN39_BRAAE|nr:unnamed protein product [Brassicogethes aeneus]
MENTETLNSRTLHRQEFTCKYCKQSFSKKFNLNRHLKNTHGEEAIGILNSKKCHIFCIICSTEKVIGGFLSYNDYISHLKETHNVQVEEKLYHFVKKEDFEVWRSSEEKEVNYALQCTNVEKSRTRIYYNCNRSDSRGFVSNCSKKISKTGGSIKINGTCPSRIIATFLPEGSITVRYIQTHVGHEIEVRTQRLSKNDQKYLVDQLKAGVCTERIVKNARTVKESDKLTRLNLVTRNDLSNLARRNNIEKMRHSNDMVATALKVHEWNSEGKNYVFLFKQLGETHSFLKVNDFALAFMNKTMEQKFREFNRIVCMDGTHGLTKYKGWELTILLVKDETKAGFPVAFMISNRQDQMIQEIFLGALKEKLGTDAPISTEFLMTDDDVKYYNAWVKTMSNSPRRLLCTWHLLKNWNIQGKRKLKTQELKNTMRKDMRKILTATNVQSFQKNKENYLKILQEQNETEFITYLQKYYFCNEARIMSWAFCYRSEVGINTNMALESLNRYIKKEKLHNNGYIRLEKLLDVLEEVVDDKMWKRIISIKRPHRNTYQGRTVAKAHRQAELIKNCVKVKGFGSFIIKSNEKTYCVTYKETCLSKNCREMFCEACKVCFHKYRCECIEYVVKSTTCKHVHVVAMYEQKQLLNNISFNEEINLNPINEGEINEFLLEKNLKTGNEVDLTLRRKFVSDHVKNYVNDMLTLNDDAFEVFAKNFEIFVNKNDKDLGILGNKRKFAKQTYYPQA